MGHLPVKWLTITACAMAWAWLLGLDEGERRGHQRGSQEGFELGRKAKTQIYIVKPPCADGAPRRAPKDSVLWRI